MKVGRICFLLLAAALMIISASGQQTRGTLQGVLKDESGAIIPAASVTLTGNGETKTAQTQADGSYAFVGLAPGQYTISVTFPGFAPYSNMVTVSGNTIQLPIQLVLATAKQEVTVNAQRGPSVSVEPENNATQLTLQGEDLAALPDDPDDLSDALQALAGPAAGPSGGSIYIDGFSGGQLPPKESIREVRINQNPFSAEYDHLGFGRIEILTKPGSDKFHGTLFLYDGNAALDSRNPLASNKPNYSKRQYGGSVGGPINKKGSFYLYLMHRTIEDNAVTHAVYLDPATFAVAPITRAVVTPMVFTFFLPRVDYQLSANNTLTVSFSEWLNERDNQGLGGYNLPSPYSQLAYNSTGHSQNLMITETAVLSPKMVNETRFQFSRNWTNSAGNLIPQIQVAGSFVTGGNGKGNNYDLSRHFELQNYTSISHGTHTIRLGVRLRREDDQNNNPQGFNGTFTFLGGDVPLLDAGNQIMYGPDGSPVVTYLTSLQQYQRNLQLQQAGLPEAQIQALGGGPSRFTIQAGLPYVSMTRWDAGPFVQDDWRMRPGLTLSLGLRYEVQTLVSDHRDVAPRIGIAWAPGSAKSGGQKTVIRAGSGMFYDRIGFGPFENSFLNNGVNRFQYTVFDPTFYPSIPTLSALNAGQNAINPVDPKLRADYSWQSAIGVERQLPGRTTISVTYTYNRANHLPQTVPVNTPLPGTFNPLLPLGPANGVFPYGYSAGNIFEYESGGILKQRIMMVNFNTRFSRRVSLAGNYSLTYAHDLPGTPTDPYDFSQDWGRSNFDRRNNFQLFGSIVGPRGVSFAPFVTIRSGAPYDVLLGQDVYGDTYENARAAFAPPGAACGVEAVVCTPLGNFLTNYSPVAPVNLVPRNYLTMPGLVALNVRVYRTFGLGPRRSANGATPGSSGGRGFGGGAPDHRFNLTVSASATNIVNHFNPGGYQGVLTSPQFGQATSVNTGFGGGLIGGGGSTANNRRIELGLTLTF